MKTICSMCEEKFEHYENENESLISLYKYNEQMKDYLHRYKFMHDILLAKVFRQQINEHLSKKKDIIVPIPMHPKKIKERTFSHVDELLKEAEIKFEHYLIKTTTDSQAFKSRKERIEMPQLFKLKEGVNLKNKKFILFDDIFTTGTTVNHAKRLLLEGGASEVNVFTLIRA